MKLSKSLLLLNFLVYGRAIYTSLSIKGQMFLRLTCSYFIFVFNKGKAALRNRVFSYFTCLVVFLVLCYINALGDTYLNYIYMSSILPIVSYDNLDQEKATAIKSNRKLSGVYRWTHKKSGKS
uniref:Uncharacterized protein n=1 Tax=Cryphonectria parasitica TaxID=5116 RepID=A0A191MX50_CRYPA|nr:hypothetical protein [Cryphonectria parasitica]